MNHIFLIPGALIWYVLSELLFSFSPNSVYSKALEVVKQNTSVSIFQSHFPAYGPSLGKTGTLVYTLGFFTFNNGNVYSLYSDAHFKKGQKAPSLLR